MGYIVQCYQYFLSLKKKKIKVDLFCFFFNERVHSCCTVCQRLTNQSQPGDRTWHAPVVSNRERFSHNRHEVWWDVSRGADSYLTEEETAGEQWWERGSGGRSRVPQLTDTSVLAAWVVGCVCGVWQWECSHPPSPKTAHKQNNTGLALYPTMIISTRCSSCWQSELSCCSSARCEPDECD